MRSLSGVVLRTQSDGKLLTLAAGGSEPAFEALVQRYRRPLHVYCRRLLVSDTRSEDVVQQALLNAWQALRAGTEVREPRAWLYRITHNQAMSALRRPEYDFSALEDSLQVADAPESDLERRALMRETLAAVAALPARQQEVILRTAVEGQSYEQVAAALGLSSHAVRGLAHRARTTLRSAMAATVPSPVVLWAAERAQPTGSAAAWVSMLSSTGGVGGAAAVIKGATLLASTAAIVGGTVGGVIHLPSTGSGRHAAHRHQAGSAAGARVAHAHTTAAEAARTSVARPAQATARPVLLTAVRTGAPGAAGSAAPARRAVQRRSSSVATTGGPSTVSARSTTTTAPGGTRQDESTSSAGGSPRGQGEWRPGSGEQGSSDQPAVMPQRTSGAGGSTASTQSTAAPPQANAFPMAAPFATSQNTGAGHPEDGGGSALGQGEAFAARASGS